ncbi:MAG: helix-hairpin-helix domain-containing protein [Hyphomicrobiaceae bacterium]
MNYFLVQSAALLLLAYLCGCWFGCFLKSIDTARPEDFEDEAVGVGARTGAGVGTGRQPEGREVLETAAARSPAATPVVEPVSTTVARTATASTAEAESGRFGRAFADRSEAGRSVTGAADAERGATIAREPSRTTSEPEHARSTGGVARGRDGETTATVRDTGRTDRTATAADTRGPAARAAGQPDLDEDRMGAAAAAAAAIAAAAAARSREVAAAGGAATAGAVSSPAADDLKRIKGIGPEIERKLNDLGVFRYADIARWRADDVKRISRELDMHGRIQHENWIEQAQILASGGATAFSRKVDMREVAASAAGGWTPQAPGEVERSAAGDGRFAAAAAAAAAASAAAAALEAVSRQRASSQSSSAATGATATPAASDGSAATTSAAAGSGMSSGAVRTGSAAGGASAATARSAATAGSTSSTPSHRTSSTSAGAGYPGGGEPLPIPGSTSGGATVAPVHVTPDDLTLIRGIGPEIARKLGLTGVRRFTDIAGWSQGDVDRFERELGFPGRIGRERWIEQARVLASGGETEFSRRQREPSGGAASGGHRGASQGGERSPGLRSVGAGTGAVAGQMSGSGSGARVLRSDTPDDLKRIRGIGVVLERKLNALGVTRYGDVAAWSPDDVARISEELDFKGRIERESWIEQAAILAGGGVTEFAKRVDRGLVSTSVDDEEA